MKTARRDAYDEAAELRAAAESLISDSYIRPAEECGLLAELVQEKLRSGGWDVDVIHLGGGALRVDSAGASVSVEARVDPAASLEGWRYELAAWEPRMGGRRAVGVRFHRELSGPFSMRRITIFEMSDGAWMTAEEDSSTWSTCEDAGLQYHDTWDQACLALRNWTRNN